MCSNNFAEVNKVFVSFTRDYYDNSTEAALGFVFFCDLCHCGYCTSFIEAGAYKRAGILHRILYIILNGMQFAKRNYFNSYSGYNEEKASKHFNKLSPEWHREHELAFEQAQNEAKIHFNCCLKCFCWVCDNDFNIDERMCVKCAPTAGKGNY